MGRVAALALAREHKSQFHTIVKHKKIVNNVANQAAGLMAGGTNPSAPCTFSLCRHSSTDATIDAAAALVNMLIVRDMTAQSTGWGELLQESNQP